MDGGCRISSNDRTNPEQGCGFQRVAARKVGINMRILCDANPLRCSVGVGATGSFSHNNLVSGACTTLCHVIHIAIA